MLSKASMAELEKIQKACVRLVNKKKKNSPTRQLFKGANILNFADMIKLELLKFGYNLRKQDIPTPIWDIMNRDHGLKRHHYSTHYKNIPNIQSHSSTIFNHSFLCKGVSTLMNARKSIKDASSLRGMIRAAKKELLSEY